MPEIQTIASILASPQANNTFLTDEEKKRILAFQQLQKMAGATNMPIYSAGTGALKVATGALGGFLEGQTERNAAAAQAANTALINEWVKSQAGGASSSTFGGVDPTAAPPPLPPPPTPSVAPDMGMPGGGSAPPMDMPAAPPPAMDVPGMGIPGAVAPPVEMSSIPQIPGTQVAPPFQHVADAPRIAPIPAPPPVDGQPAMAPAAGLPTPDPAVPVSPMAPAVMPGDMDRGMLFNPATPSGLSEGATVLPNAAVKPVPIGPNGEVSSLAPSSPMANDPIPRPPADIPNASASINPGLMRAVAQIESGGNPNAVTGSYKGLYQLSESEFRRYGGQGSIFDPAENARVAKLKLADEAKELSQSLGRPVSEADIYLAHQQGVGGATAHLTHPERKAWESMYSTGEGQQKGEGWAKRAIWGNIPDAAKEKFGSVDNVTSGQFAQLWRERYARAAGTSSDQSAPAGVIPTASQQPASASPAQSGPSPQRLAQALQSQPQAASPERARALGMQLLTDPRTPPQIKAAILQQLTPQKPIEYGGRLIDPRNGNVIRDLRDPEDLEGKRLDLQVKRQTLEGKPTFGVIGKDQFGNEQYGWIDPKTRSATPAAAPAQQSDGVIPPPPPGVDPKVWREEQSKRFTRGSLPASFEDESKLRGEFQQLPSYKNITQALPVYKSMIDAAGRNDRGSDVNLIYGFAKVMDPTSVVRESEMTVAQAIATLPEQLQQSVKSQLGNGGRLSPEVRQQIMTEAQSRVQSYKSMYDNDAGMFGEVAKKYKADPDRVVPKFGDIPVYKPPESKANPAAPVALPDRVALEAEARRRGLLK